MLKMTQIHFNLRCSNYFLKIHLQNNARAFRIYILPIYAKLFPIWDCYCSFHKYFIKWINFWCEHELLYIFLQSSFWKGIAFTQCVYSRTQKCWRNIAKISTYFTLGYWHKSSEFHHIEKYRSTVEKLNW